MFDVEQLRNDADCIVVAEQLGIPMQRAGSRFMILCPNHADKNMGSCYLNHQGYYCFSCHHKGDVFDLVQKEKDVGFNAACDYVAEICGGRELYQIDGTTQSATYSSELGLPFISKQAQNFLGIEDKPIYQDVGVCYWDEKEDYMEMGYLVVQQDVDGVLKNGNPNGNLLFRVLKPVSRSPLYDLYQENPDIYIQMIDEAIDQKCREIDSLYASLNLDSLYTKYRKEIQTLQEIASTYGSKAICPTDYSLVNDLSQAWNEEGGF